MSVFAGTGIAAAGPGSAEPPPVPAATPARTTFVGPRERPDKAAAQLAARLSGERIEITGERTESSTTWANPDGTLTTDTASGPIRVRRDDGWVPLDLTLVASDGRLRPKASPADISFSAGGTGPLTLQSAPGGTLAFGWKGALPAPEVSGGVATYRNVWPNADLEVAATSLGFKERVIVHSRPAAAPVVRFPLTAKGLSVGRGRGREIVAKDAAGRVVAQAPAPRMWDAKIDERSGDPARNVEIPTQIVNGELVLSPSMSFFNDPAIEYPVVIDPSMSLTNAGDTWVQNDYTSSQMGDPWLKVGTYDGGAHVARSLIKWGTSSITGKHVQAATMSLYQHWSYSCTASGMNLGPVNGAFGSTTVWTNQPTYTGTYGTTATFAKGYSSSCPDGRQSINIIGMTDAWADGNLTNYGLKMWGNGEGDSNTWKKFCSGNVSASSADAPCTTSANVPTMSVTYNSYPAVPTTLSPANGSYTNDLTPTFKAKLTDPDGGNLSGRFYIQTSSGVWVANGGVGSTVASGGTTSYTRTSGFSNGGSYQWRVRGYDGTDLGSPAPTATTWYTFTVDTTAPNMPTATSTTYPQNQWGGSAGTAGTFTFGNGGSTDVVGYYYGLNQNPPSTYTTATSASITPPKDGPHTLYVRSKDRAGNLSTIRSYAFNVGGGVVTSPSDGDRTQKRFTLEAVGQMTATTVKFQHRRGDTDTWADVPYTALTWESDGTALSSVDVTMTANSTNTAKVSRRAVWDVAATVGATEPDGPIQVRAVFAPSSIASPAVLLTLDRAAYGDYASEDVGVGTVNLVTGNLTVSQTDASVGASGTDMSLSRTYQSRDAAAGTGGMFGAPWTSSAEAGPSGDHGQLTDGGSVVTIETANGDTIGFTKKSTGGYASEIGLEDLVLTKSAAPADTFSLKDGQGNVTVFAPVTLTTTSAATTSSNSIPVADATKLSVNQFVDVKTNGTATVANRKITAISGSSVTFDGAAASIASGAKVVPTKAYAPSQVTQPGLGNTTSYGYETLPGGTVRVARVLGPTGGLTCPAYPATLLTSAAKGCRALEMHYATTTSATGTAEAQWGDVAGRVSSVGFVTWNAAAGAMVEVTVARYLYDLDGTTSRLRAAWDPRISPALKTVYDYDSAGHVTGVTPPSERTTPAPLAPWTIAYSAITGDGNTGRLSHVSRTSSTTGETRTTVVYGVPVTGTGAPHDLGSAETAKWAQTVQPRDATAVFETTSACGTAVATTAPLDYGCAAVHYADVNGRRVNTADPSGGGITTSEYDNFGNLVRGLTAVNRQRALDSSTDPAAQAATARELDEQSVYSADGTRLLEVFGPAHPVQLPDGRIAEARAHLVNVYDEGAPAGDPYNLVTTATNGARETGTTVDVDVRTTKTTYDWTLRQPTAVTTDAVTGGLNLATRVTYDATTGLQTSVTTPAGGTTTNTARTTVTAYYTAAARLDYPACGLRPEWVNLACRIGPASQPGTADMPDLPVTVLTYNEYHSPTTMTETVGATSRTTTIDYDAAGRPTVATMSGGVGTAVPPQATAYDPATGVVSATCDTSCAPGNPRVSSVYDDFGRRTSYTDAAGVTSTTTYDVASRPVVTSDGKGTQTRTYDEGTERRSAVTRLVDSSAGTFTATYDVAGGVTETYPNGIVATSRYDEAGARVQVTYDQPGCAATDCTWLSDTNVVSIHGQVLNHSGLSEQSYTYDRTGRLTLAEDLADGACTSRAYTLDANSNRTQLIETVRDETCTTTASTTTTTSYVDAADRLHAASPRTAGNTNDYAYDTFGRITRVPATHARLSSEITPTYFADDMVRSVTSGGTTRTWSRDPVGRLAGWTDAVPAAGMTSVNHYDGDDDKPSWTAETADGSVWTRTVGGIVGSLGLVRGTTPGTTVEFLLTNLHGDAAIVASSADTAPPSPLATFDSDEFGVRRASNATTPRYGWLGGAERSSEVPGGLVLMGARLYLPTIGRFLQVDPVRGGSANAYDYANQDPVNLYDLDGRSVIDGGGTAERCTCSSSNYNWKRIRVVFAYSPWIWLTKSNGNLFQRMLDVAMRLYSYLKSSGALQFTNLRIQGRRMFIEYWRCRNGFKQYYYVPYLPMDSYRIRVKIIITIPFTPFVLKQFTITTSWMLANGSFTWAGF